MKADVFGRIEFFDRLHQADVTFLNQIHVVGTRMEIFGGDGDRYAQIGHDEFDRRVSAAVRAIFFEEPQFFFF